MVNKQYQLRNVENRANWYKVNRHTTQLSNIKVKVNTGTENGFQLASGPFSLIRELVDTYSEKVQFIGA